MCAWCGKDSNSTWKNLELLLSLPNAKRNSMCLHYDSDRFRNEKLTLLCFGNLLFNCQFYFIVLSSQQQTHNRLIAICIIVRFISLHSTSRPVIRPSLIWSTAALERRNTLKAFRRLLPFAKESCRVERWMAPDHRKMMLIKRRCSAHAPRSVAG